MSCHHACNALSAADNNAASMSSDNEYSDNDYYDDEDDMMLDDEDGASVPCLTPRSGARADKAAGSASDLDIDTYEGDYKVSGKGKAKVYEVEFESYNQPQVEGMMKRDLDDISGIFGVDVSTAPLSLRPRSGLFIPHSVFLRTSPALLLCS